MKRTYHTFSNQNVESDFLDFKSTSTFIPNKRLKKSLENELILDNHPVEEYKFNNYFKGKNGWNMKDEKHRNYFQHLQQTTQSIPIFVQCLNGKKHEIIINPSSDIKILKEKIMRKLNIDINYQRLVFNGKICPDDSSISELCIENGSTINLISQVKGG